MKNTKKSGKFTLFVYKEKPNYHIGVCLEFDLIQEGKSALEAMFNIKKASIAYLGTIIKKNFSDDLLNNYAPEEYWKKYYEYLKKRTQIVKKIEEEIKARQHMVKWDDFVGVQNLQQEILYNPNFFKQMANG